MQFMIPIDLSGKVALVTGVGDNDSFAWYIAKHLQAAGARLIFSCHPRVVGIVESFLTRAQDAESRTLPHGKGELKPEKTIACDVSFDSLDDVDEKTKTDRRFARYGDFTIKGMMDVIAKDYSAIDILIHSVAFSREITRLARDTSRKAYLEALSISSYSLTGLVRAAAPLMANRPDTAAVVSLTYLGGERVIPHYGGGMSTAKAALQIDTKQLAQNYGKENIRVNAISAGPYASRAARSIVSNFDQLIAHAAEHSPLPRPITPDQVAAACLFLCSPLATAITGQILYVDNGLNIMGA
jgi:enoyl-[acyl-carrier protein] reductase I